MAFLEVELLARGAQTSQELTLFPPPSWVTLVTSPTQV